MAGKVALKKYANRRIYDTEKSAYVTLDDVRELIRSGREVSVTDASSGDDVTAAVLLQILAEEAKNKNFLLPVSFLHLVIQQGQNVLREFFDKYLELTIRNYLLYKTAFDEQFKSWLDMGKNFPGLGPDDLPGAAQWESLVKLFLNPEKRDK